MGMYEDLIEVDEEYERWASENPQYEDEPMAGRDFTYGDEEDEHGNVQQHTILDDPVYDAWYRNAYGDDPDTPTIERDLRAEETRDAMYRTVSGEAENRNTGLSGLLNKGLGKTYEGAVTGGWQGNNLTPYGMAFNIEDKPGLFDAANFAMNAATLPIVSAEVREAEVRAMSNAGKSRTPAEDIRAAHMLPTRSDVSASAG